MFFPLFMGHIGGNLPQILTADEEAKYVRLWENGDVSARNELIEHNLRLVAHIAKKYNQSGDCEELISVGTIGLIKAVSTYRSDKGRLATYASKCIENAMVTLGRRRLIICNNNKGLNIINDRLYLTCH